MCVEMGQKNVDKIHGLRATQNFKLKTGLNCTLLSVDNSKFQVFNISQQYFLYGRAIFRTVRDCSRMLSLSVTITACGMYATLCERMSESFTGYYSYANLQICQVRPLRICL